MGHYVTQIYHKTGEEFEAFVPSIIDGSFEFSDETIARFTELDNIVRRLNDCDFDSINNYIVRYSAGGTALRDGRNVSRKRLALIGANVMRLDLEARTILMHCDALKESMDIGCELVYFDVDAFKAIAAPMKNDRGNAGKFRRGHGWIGGENPIDAYYCCPPTEYLEELLAPLCDFINREDIPATLQAAIAHVQFSIIHPLSDGNGRTARVLAELVLRRRGLITAVAPPALLYRLTLDNNEYIGAIKEFEKENYQPIYDFWYDANVWATDLVLEMQSRRNEYVDYIVEKFAQANIELTDDLKTMTDGFFAQPIVTPEWLTEKYGISLDQAMIQLNLLVNAGICQNHKLREPKDKQIWDVPKVFELISQFDKGVFGIG